MVVPLERMRCLDRLTKHDRRHQWHEAGKQAPSIVHHVGSPQTTFRRRNHDR